MKETTELIASLSVPLSYTKIFQKPADGTIYIIGIAIVFHQWSINDTL